MKKKTTQSKDLKILHSLDAFGIRKVSHSKIRIEKLEDRLEPSVPFPHKHDFFQVLLVTSGTGAHQIDFKNHAVKAGQIFLMKPGQMHSWDLRRGIRGFIVEFGLESLSFIKESPQLIDDFSLLPDVLTLPTKKDFTELEALTVLMQDEFAQARRYHDQSLQGYLLSLLILLLRSTGLEQRPPKVLGTIQRFKQLVEKNFKTAHGVEFYAKELRTSAKALTMQLTRSVQKPPRQIIQERILLEAKRFLAFSDLSVAEVGYELGFEDANYFIRFSRQHVKVTPARFRKVAAPQ